MVFCVCLGLGDDVYLYLGTTPPDLNQSHHPPPFPPQTNKTRNNSYLRVLAPALDMCNHDPHAAEHLDELLQHDPSDDTLALKTHGQHPAVGPGQQCHLFYGPYSNAKLLYSYGFVAPRNPFRGVDYWVRVPPTARDAGWKEEQRAAHELTARQTYDFAGTLRGSESAIGGGGDGVCVLGRREGMCTRWGVYVAP